jgi:predicted acylesterase/phospholipase RssA
LLATDEIDVLWDIYKNVKRENILIERKDGISDLTGNSLYDVAPMERLINQLVTSERFERILTSGKQIFISTVCPQNQRPTYFTNTDLKGNKDYDVIKWRDREHFVSAIMGSSVMPVVMPPVVIDGKQYVDGGVRNFLPSDIVMDAGATDVTAILTTPENPVENDTALLIDFKAILHRTIDIFYDEVGRNDLRITELQTKNTNYLNEMRERIRKITSWSDEQLDSVFDSPDAPIYNEHKINLRVVRPGKSLGEGFTFDNMQGMLELGYDSLDRMTVFFS